MSRNRHDYDPYARYPHTEKAKEKRRKKHRVTIGIATLASAGAAYMGATHSDAIGELMRSHPLPITEQLSHADYQTQVLEPALSNVESITNRIELTKMWLQDKNSAESGTVELSNESATDVMSLRLDSNSLENISKTTYSNGSEHYNRDTVEITYDNTGTSIVVGSESSIDIAGRPQPASQKIVFHNPANVTIDLNDLTTVEQAVADPNTTVTSVVSTGSFGSETDDNQSWYSYLSPIEVTFEQNEDKSITAQANTDKLDSGYEVNPKATPTMDDVLKFEFPKY